MILEGKRLLITGVITKDSIAYHAAEQAQREGAVGGADQLRPGAADDRARRPAAARAAPTCSSSTSTSPRTSTRSSSELRERWGGLDGALHAIAFAPEDALGGKFLTAPAESADAGVSDQRVLAEGARRPRWRR